MTNGSGWQQPLAPRAPRIKDPALMRLLKHEYDECEISGVTGDLHLHHVIFKSHSGDDLRENILCVTESLHTAYHQHDARIRLVVARHIDEQRHDIACYIAEKLGSADALLDWFARHGLDVPPVDVETWGLMQGESW